MNYASLHASLQPKTVPKTQIVSLTYNKSALKTPTATASSAPNTIMLRDANSSTNISTLHVGAKLYVADGATISGGLKIFGTIDTSLGAGIVCSSSSGVLATRQITSADIADLSIRSADICDKAVTTSKLALNLFLSGNPTCDNNLFNDEKLIANIGYVNKYVTNYVNRKLESIVISENNYDVDEFNPCIFHATQPNYVVSFNYATYVIENATTVINMPRKKKEGYFVKIYNKSGDSIFINSDGDRLMYNATYSPVGTYSQVVENNRCVIFTYVYVNTTRSWSYEYF